jgi:hypothetical protein
MGNSDFELIELRDRSPVFINIAHVYVKTLLIGLFRQARCKLIQHQKDFSL